MGLFGWLKNLLGSKQPPPTAPLPRSSAPQHRQAHAQVLQAAGAKSSAPPPLPPPSRRPSPPRQDVTLDLSAGPFAPLSHEQVKEQARALGSPWANAFFGRRDLIPPASDPRTQLIDRAMVAQGLITPEELAEIHQVGQQMDQIKPDLAVAAHQARLAAQASVEERQRRKAQKQQEAQERKRRRAEAVALRKKSDIIYLGRGVSAGLADRTANLEKLQAAGLPILATPADVAGALGLSIQRLRWLSFHADAAVVRHYITFSVPKRSGGLRELSAPHRDLAATQEWILRNILDKVPVHEAAHGFVAGRSTVSNATPHVGRAVVVNADLKDFFPTITFWRACGVFEQLGYSPAASTIMALLCTEAPRRTVGYAGQTLFVATGPRCLPQGACTSPALSNLVARNLDARLFGIARKLHWTYTRYADDLTFSADGEAAKQVGYLLARLRHIAQDEGFAVNEKKTRIQRPHMAQSVTGILVNRRPGVERDLVRRLRAILHQAKKTGLKAQNREKLPHFEAWLRGMIAYICMVNPEQGTPLREALATINQGPVE